MSYFLVLIPREFLNSFVLTTPIFLEEAGLLKAPFPVVLALALTNSLCAAAVLDDDDDDEAEWAKTD